MKRKDIKKRPLADTTLASLEPESMDYREKDLERLYFRVKKSGGKDWQIRYKDHLGRWRWHGIGSYPTVSGAMARKIYHEKLLELQATGELTAKTKDPNAKTFERVAREWYNEPKIQNLANNTKVKYISVLEKHVFEKMGHKEITHITRLQWLEFFKQLQNKVNPKTGEPIIETATRARQVVERIYRFAMVENLTEYNPLDNLSERLEKHTTKQMPHVNTSDIHKLIDDLKTAPSEITRLGLLLQAHLFLRPTSLFGAKWCEVDFDNAQIEIPPERMKNRNAFVVPLSKQALEMLKQLYSLTGYTPYLFPSRNDDTKPSTNDRFRQALKRMNYNDKQTLHGFRHLFSTIANNHTDKNGNKFDERVIEFSIAHKVQGVKGVYNKAEYLHDRRILMQWYSDYLDNLL